MAQRSHIHGLQETRKKSRSKQRLSFDSLSSNPAVCNSNCMRPLASALFSSIPKRSPPVYIVHCNADAMPSEYTTPFHRHRPTRARLHSLAGFSDFVIIFASEIRTQTASGLLRSRISVPFGNRRRNCGREVVRWCELLVVCSLNRNMSLHKKTIMVAVVVKEICRMELREVCVSFGASYHGRDIVGVRPRLSRDLIRQPGGLF